MLSLETSIVVCDLQVLWALLAPSFSQNRKLQISLLFQPLCWDTAVSPSPNQSPILPAKRILLRQWEMSSRGGLWLLVVIILL